MRGKHEREGMAESGSEREGKESGRAPLKAQFRLQDGCPQNRTKTYRDGEKTARDTQAHFLSLRSEQDDVLLHGGGDQADQHERSIHHHESRPAVGNMRYFERGTRHPTIPHAFNNERYVFPSQMAAYFAELTSGL